MVIPPAIHHDLYGLANQRSERGRARERHRGSDAGVAVQSLVKISARLVVRHEAKDGLVPGVLVSESVAPCLPGEIQSSQDTPDTLEHFLLKAKSDNVDRKQTACVETNGGAACSRELREWGVQR